MQSFLTRLAGAALAATLALGATFARAADDFPAKPIHVIVPYAAGGADNFIRPLQPALEKRHNMKLVIESVVGAGGTVGSGRVKRSAPDGYTLLFCGSGALTIAPKLQEGAAPTLADFEPVLNLATIPYIIAVRKDVPIESAREFIDFVKRNPDKLNYGTPGTGSAPHLGMEALAARLGTRLTHVPFSGIATAVQSVLGGHIEAVIGAPSVVMPQVRAGKVKAIGVTSRQRFALTPEIPALAEAGADVEVATHFGFLAPKGTPRQVTERIAAALRDAAREPAFASAMEAMQTQVNILSAEAFSRALAMEASSFEPVIKAIARK